MNADYKTEEEPEWDEEPEEDWLGVDDFRRTKRAVAAVVVVTILGAGGWWLWRQVALPKASEEHVQLALEYLDEGQGMSALIELKNALQKNASNAEAHFLMGRLYLENGEIAAAEKDLRQARFLGYDEAVVAPLLARVYLAQGKTEELLALGLGALPAVAQSGLTTPQGRVQLNAGNIARGAELVKQAQSAYSESSYDILSRARLLASQQNLIDARALVETLLDREAANTGALMLLGDIERDEGDLDAAEIAYGQAIKAAINPNEAQLKRALVRLQKQNYKQAQLDVYQLLLRLPNHPSVHYVQGVIHFQNQEYQKAIASLLIAEKSEKRYPLSLFYAGVAHHNLGNRDQAREYANRFHTLAPDDVYGRRLLAMLELSSRNFQAAEKIIQPVVNDNPDDWVSLDLLANALLAQGRSEEGLVLLSLAAELRPDSSVAQGRLGAGQLLAGNRSAGIAQLEAALEMNPEFKQADKLLVLNYVRQGDYDKAINSAEAYRRRSPVSAEPFDLLARVYLAAGQADKAREAFLEALKIDPADATANHGLADMAVAEGDYDKARAHYNTVLAAHENFLPTLLKLAELAAAQRKLDELVIYLQRAMLHHPKRLSPRILMARYYLRTENPGQVALLFNDLHENQKNRPEVLQVVALAQLAEKDYPAAKVSFEKLSEMQPQAAQVHYQLARVHAALDETGELEESLKTSLKLAPNFVPARYMLASLYLSQGQAERAEPHLNKLREMAPEAPELLALEASSARLLGDEQQALVFAERAYEALPTATTLLQLVDILHQQGDVQRAQLFLTHWLSRHPNDARVMMAQANSKALQNDNAAAVQQYQAVLEQDKDNVMALNNLAWYLRDTQPQLALAYAEKATQLDPDWAAAQDTLALVLLSNGMIQRARQAITRALDRDPSDPSILYHSAMISARAGDRRTAREVLQPLLVSGETFPEMEEAMALYGELSGGE